MAFRHCSKSLLLKSFCSLNGKLDLAQEEKRQTEQRIQLVDRYSMSIFFLLYITEWMKSIMTHCLRSLHTESNFHSLPCGCGKFGEQKSQLNTKTCGWILLHVRVQALWFSIYCSSDCTIKCVIRLTSDVRRFSASLFLGGHLINAWWWRTLAL